MASDDIKKVSTQAVVEITGTGLEVIELRELALDSERFDSANANVSIARVIYSLVGNSTIERGGNVVLALASGEYDFDFAHSTGSISENNNDDIHISLTDESDYVILFLDKEQGYREKTIIPDILLNLQDNLDCFDVPYLTLYQGGAFVISDDVLVSDDHEAINKGDLVINEDVLVSDTFEYLNVVSYEIELNDITLVDEEVLFGGMSHSIINDDDVYSFDDPEFQKEAKELVRDDTVEFDDAIELFQIEGDTTYLFDQISTFEEIDFVGSFVHEQLLDEVIVVEDEASIGGISHDVELDSLFSPDDEFEYSKDAKDHLIEDVIGDITEIVETIVLSGDGTVYLDDDISFNDEFEFEHVANVVYTIYDDVSTFDWIRNGDEHEVLLEEDILVSEVIDNARTIPLFDEGPDFDDESFRIPEHTSLEYIPVEDVLEYVSEFVPNLEDDVEIGELIRFPITFNNIIDENVLIDDVPSNVPAKEFLDDVDRIDDDQDDIIDDGDSNITVVINETIPTDDEIIRQISYNAEIEDEYADLEDWIRFPITVNNIIDVSVESFESLSLHPETVSTDTLEDIVDLGTTHAIGCSPSDITTTEDEFDRQVDFNHYPEDLIDDESIYELIRFPLTINKLVDPDLFDTDDIISNNPDKGFLDDVDRIDDDQDDIIDDGDSNVSIVINETVYQDDEFYRQVSYNSELSSEYEPDDWIRFPVTVNNFIDVNVIAFEIIEKEADSVSTDFLPDFDDQDIENVILISPSDAVIGEDELSHEQIMNRGIEDEYSDLDDWIRFPVSVDVIEDDDIVFEDEQHSLFDQNYTDSAAVEDEHVKTIEQGNNEDAVFEEEFYRQIDFNPIWTDFLKKGDGVYFEEDYVLSSEYYTSEDALDDVLIRASEYKLDLDVSFDSEDVPSYIPVKEFLDDVDRIDDDQDDIIDDGDSNITIVINETVPSGDEIGFGGDANREFLEDVQVSDYIRFPIVVLADIEDSVSLDDLDSKHVYSDQPDAIGSSDDFNLESIKSPSDVVSTEDEFNRTSSFINNIEDEYSELEDWIRFPIIVDVLEEDEVGLTDATSLEAEISSTDDVVAETIALDHQPTKGISSSVYGLDVILVDGGDTHDIEDEFGIDDDVLFPITYLVSPSDDVLLDDSTNTAPSKGLLDDVDDIEDTNDDILDDANSTITIGITDNFHVPDSIIRGIEFGSLIDDSNTEDSFIIPLNLEQQITSDVEAGEVVSKEIGTESSSIISGFEDSLNHDIDSVSLDDVAGIDTFERTVNFERDYLSEFEPEETIVYPLVIIFEPTEDLFDIDDIISNNPAKEFLDDVDRIDDDQDDIIDDGDSNITVVINETIPTIDEFERTVNFERDYLSEFEQDDYIVFPIHYVFELTDLYDSPDTISIQPTSVSDDILDSFGDEVDFGHQPVISDATITEDEFTYVQTINRSIEDEYDLSDDFAFPIHYLYEPVEDQEVAEELSNNVEVGVESGAVPEDTIGEEIGLVVPDSVVFEEEFYRQVDFNPLWTEFLKKGDGVYFEEDYILSSEYYTTEDALDDVLFREAIYNRKVDSEFSVMDYINSDQAVLDNVISSDELYITMTRDLDDHSNAEDEFAILEDFDLLVEDDAEIIDQPIISAIVEISLDDSIESIVDDIEDSYTKEFLDDVDRIDDDQDDIIDDGDSNITVVINETVPTDDSDITRLASYSIVVDEDSDLEDWIRFPTEIEHDPLDEVVVEDVLEENHSTSISDDVIGIDEGILNLDIVGSESVLVEDELVPLSLIKEDMVNLEDEEGMYSWVLDWVVDDYVVPMEDEVEFS